MEEKTVKLSDKREVVIAPLSGFESMAADEYLGGTINAIKLGKVYAICSVRKLDGRVVQPCDNPLDYKAIQQTLSLPELLNLVEAYGELEDVPTGEALKNASGDESPAQ